MWTDSPSVFCRLSADSWWTGRFVKVSGMLLLCCAALWPFRWRAVARWVRSVHRADNSARQCHQLRGVSLPTENPKLEWLSHAEGFLCCTSLFPSYTWNIYKNTDFQTVHSIYSAKEICVRFYQTYKQIFLPLDITNIKGFIHLKAVAQGCNQQKTKALHF